MSKKQRLRIRPITKQDILEFNNGKLYDKGLRGLAVELDGEPIGIAGVMHTTPLQVFSEMKDAMRQYPVMIMKTAKKMQSLMSTYDSPMVAKASKNERNPTAFLERIGFEFIGENEDGRFYSWQHH